MKQSQNLTAQESLDIITKMIREAKGGVRNNSVYFLLWGWIVVMANLGMFALAQAGYRYPFIVWAITIPAWIYSLYRGFTQERRQQAMTHLGSITLWLWVTFGVCIFTIIGFGHKINYQVNPLIMILSAIPTFLSGITIRFRPLCYGGVALWIFGMASFLTPREYQPLIGAAGITLGYLIPGYMLRSKND